MQMGTCTLSLGEKNPRRITDLGKQIVADLAGFILVLKAGVRGCFTFNLHLKRFILGSVVMAQLASPSLKIAKIPYGC